MQTTHQCSLLLPVGRGDGKQAMRLLALVMKEEEELLSCLVSCCSSRLLEHQLCQLEEHAGLQPKLVQLLGECY